MKLGKHILAGLACMLAVACSSNVDVFSKLPDGTKDKVSVSNIHVALWDDPDGSGPKPDPALENSLKSALKRALRGGAGKPVDINVYVTDLENVEPGEKWFLGGYRGMTAEVQILEADGGKMIGHYRIVEDLAKPSFIWPILDQDDPSDVEIAGNFASSVRRLLYY